MMTMIVPFPSMILPIPLFARWHLFTVSHAFWRILRFQTSYARQSSPLNPLSPQPLRPIPLTSTTLSLTASNHQRSLPPTRSDMSHLYQDDHPSAHEILDPTLGGDGDLEQAYVDEALAQQYTEDTVSQYQQHQQQLAQNTLQGIEHLYNTSGDVVLDQEDGVGGSRIPEDQYLTEQPTLEHPDLGDGVGEVPEKIDGRKSGNHNRNPHGNNQYGKPGESSRPSLSLVRDS